MVLNCALVNGCSLPSYRGHVKIKTCTIFTYFLYRLIIQNSEPPYLRKEPTKEMSIVEHNRVMLPCPVYGTPQPSIRWFKNSSVITFNEPSVQLLSDGSLLFDSVEAHNVGSYKCFAENPAGNLSISIDLTVFS